MNPLSIVLLANKESAVLFLLICNDRFIVNIKKFLAKLFYIKERSALECSNFSIVFVDFFV